MSIWDDIGKAFEDAARTVFDGVIEGAQFLFDGIERGYDTVTGAISAGARSCADFVEGVAFVIVREVKNAAGEVARSADEVWTHIRAVAEPGKTAPAPLAMGARVHEPGGAVYLMIDGKLRHIPNQATYEGLFKDWLGIIDVASARSYPLGPPLAAGAWLARDAADGRVFLVDGRVRRWIITAHVFERFAFNADKVRTAGAAELAALPEGAPISGEYIPNGRRVVDHATGAVYLMIDDNLRHIPNPATYNNLFRDWKSIGDLGNVHGQRRGPALTDGAYLAKGTPDGKVFLVVDGTKRWIAGPPVMDRFGFKWEAIRGMSAQQLAAIPDGATID